MTDFKPMLAGKAKFKPDPHAEPDEDGNVPEIPDVQFPLSVQTKIDGIRCAIVNGKAMSRTLKEIPNREIFEYLSRPEFEGLDGEIVVGDPTAEDAYRTTVSFVMASGKTDEPWTYYVFDKWDAEGPYEARREIADFVVASAADHKHLLALNSFTVNNQDELTLYEKEYAAAGYEGIMLRDPQGLYKFGRGTAKKGDLIKLKRFEDSEAEIIAVVEEFHNANEATTNELGRTARSSHKANKIGKGTLGALTVKEGDMTFNIGTGFDAAQRREFWEKQDDLIGKTVKYKHFPIGKKDVPRHPVFLGFRDMEIDG